MYKIISQIKPQWMRSVYLNDLFGMIKILQYLYDFTMERYMYMK